MVMSLICAGATSKVSRLKSYINIILHIKQVILRKKKKIKLLQKENGCTVTSSFFFRPGNTYSTLALVMQLRHRRHNSSWGKKKLRQEQLISKERKLK